MLKQPGLTLLFLLSTAIRAVLAQPVHASDHAVILQYHHFGEDTPPSTSVTPSQFDDHLKYLYNHGFSVWPLDSIVTYIRDGRDLPERCVAITIDDAYVSVYKKAYPRLKERGWPFTVFVATEGVDLGYSAYMTWDQMQEMSSHGASFSSHGHTHGHMIMRLEAETETAWRTRVENDISTSLRRLEEMLGSRSKLFAYPYGEYDNRLKETSLRMGLVCFGQQSGAVWAGSDFGCLPRFAISSRFALMENFILRVNSLPLPVISTEPDDPLLPVGVTKPVLRLKISDGDYIHGSIACYASGQGRIDFKWVDPKRGLVEVVARSPLPYGRSRYNITALHIDGNRYYWYSHPWIRTEGRP